jgi:P4 family phage/plasmid primase-like protien
MTSPFSPIKEEQKERENTITEKEKLKLEYLSLTSGRYRDWSRASEILVSYIKNKLKIYTTKDDNKSEMWVYKEGIYIPQGKSEIKEILREVLEEQFSIFIYNIILNKVQADTFIDQDVFFSFNYPGEIPVKNGILNIFTRELIPFTSDKIFFTKLPVTYNPSSICQKIIKFLKDVLAKEDDEKIIYEIGGFGLLKDYRFEKAFMFVGNGRNGKDKTLELIKRLVGVENCCSVPLNSLTSESFVVSELFGKLFNLAGDLDNKDLKDTGMFKACTGRSLLGGQRKFLNNINFVNYAKFVFACNDLPMVYDTSRGFWDRWILLNFPYTFVTQEEYDKQEDKTFFKIKDENIIDKIATEEEMSGFLNLCLDGLDRLIKNKQFSTTQGSDEVKSSWIRKSNSFVAFCEEHIEQCYDGKILKKDLRKVYSDYCKEHKVPGKSDIVIKIVLQELFGAIDEKLQLSTLNYQEWYWTGIKWK